MASKLFGIENKNRTKKIDWMNLGERTFLHGNNNLFCQDFHSYFYIKNTFEEYVFLLHIAYQLLEITFDYFLFLMQSFSEKLVGLMARPGQSEPPKDDIPWYMRYGAQGLGIVGAFCMYSYN